MRDCIGMVQKCKVPVTLLILGTLSGLSWVNRYPAVSHRLAQGDTLPVWFLAIATLIAPLLIMVGIACIDSRLHAKAGIKPTFVESFARVGLAHAPVALYMLASMLWPPDSYLRTSPFGFFASLLMMLVEGNTEWSALLTEWVATAWLCFFLIYAKLSRLSTRGLAIAIATIPIYATLVMGGEIAVVTRWID